MLILEVKKRKRKSNSIKAVFKDIYITLTLHGLEHFIFSLPVKAVTSEMATHYNILVWEIPWTEENAGLTSMESQKNHK